MQQTGTAGSYDLSSDYRYGYNGKEKDDEIKGEANSLDYGARIYDPRVGRWMSTDPQSHETPDWSPYRAFFDDPINFIDSDGEREKRALKFAAEKLYGIDSYHIRGKTLSANMKIPDGIVCNELVYLSYLSITGNPYGKAGWNKSGRRQMFNWFNKKGGNISRDLIVGTENEGIKINDNEYKVDFDRTSFDKIEEGDVLFMGNYSGFGDGYKDQWASNAGHVVLAVEVATELSTENSVTIRIFGAYADNNLQNGKASGFELMTFTKDKIKGDDGKEHIAWRSSHNSSYILYGIGRVTDNKNDKDVDTDKIKNDAKKETKR